MTVFDKQWFEIKQQPILKLVNAKSPLIRCKARDILCLTDIEDNIPIQKIMPNGFIYPLDKMHSNAVLRTHEKYSKRMFYGLHPLWKLMHTWDMYIANQILKRKLNLGFDTLPPIYPQAGGGGANVTCDGRIYSLNTGGETWASIRATADGALTNDTSSACIALRCDSLTDKWDYVQRGFISFDISAITSTITGAIISLYTSAVTDNWSGKYGSLVASTQANANNLATSDFNSFGTTKFVTDFLIGSLSTSAYNDLTLNTDGINYLNANSVPMFCTIAEPDLSNTEPAWANAYSLNMTIYWADNTGESQDPKLILTIPSDNNALFFGANF